MVIELKLVQDLNVPYSILEIESGKVIEVSPVQ